MKHVESLLSLVSLLVLTTLFMTIPVYAYLDPGTGSMIIQLAIATFVAAGAFIKIKWNAIKKYFSKNK